MENYKLFQIILYIFLIQNLLFICGVSGYCNFNGDLYEDNSIWQNNCKNCTCVNSIIFCEQIQCKYEACAKGQIYLLSNNDCCPKCDYPKKSCKYEGFLIDHNTEFSPKFCETCKCRDGLIECVNTCYDNQKENSVKIDNNNELCLINGEFVKCKYDSICMYDQQEYKNNSLWSPIPCSYCKCENEVVNCYVIQCPVIECQNGYEIKVGECCPNCKPQMCVDESKLYKDGEYWTRENDQCTHCSCQNGKVSCFTETCTNFNCAKDEILVSKPNKCCPQCVSRVNENCEYYGKTYYSGDMWYKSGCQHCSCDYGRVSCTNIECEAKFCLKDEIMVKRKDECCVECRKPIYCETDSNLKIKENEFWSPEPCRLCQCLVGETRCYTNNCYDSKFSQSFFEIKFSSLGNYILNTNNLYFLNQLKQFLNKDTTIQVLSGPKYGAIYVNDKRRSNFTISDMESSNVIYKHFKEDTAPNFDYFVINTVSSISGFVYTTLVKITLNSQELKQYESNTKHLSNEKVMMNDEDVSPKSGHKTIHVIPGESVKLTPNELKPKHINSNTERLMYTLVSGKPKFGEIKLKKLFGSDDIIPPDWNQVNDIYLEKIVKEFSHVDLENGNVWYEPFNDNEDQDDDCRKNNNNDNFDYQNDINCASGDPLECSLLLKSNSNCNNMLSKSSSNTQNSKYDHLMFEVYDKEKLNQVLSKEIIHFNIQSQVINETILGLEVIENQVTPFTFSNFDITGIDSGREYLVYKIVKPLEKNQGQLEHSSKPGVPIEIFTQNDLNKGSVLYHSPKEIGMYPKDFVFTFIVTNDNRSDTFPETPFHIRVLPSNDQAPTFKEGSANLKLTQSGSITLPKELFDVEDPDTPIDNILFAIEKPPDNLILELRSKGHHYTLNKDESFTIDKIRNGTIRLIHNGANIEKDSFKISVSDGKHVTIKTFHITIQLIDNVAPRIANNTSMVFNVKEGQNKILRREYIALVDDKSSAEDIVFTLTNKLLGKLLLKNKQLKANMKFTQADIDLQNLKYEAPQEIGSITVNDFIQFNVNDKEGNVLKDQVLTVTIEPIDNQKPIVEITQPVKVQEGGYLVLNEDYIRIRDTDSAKEQLNIVIDSQPRFGYFENTSKGTKLSSFPLTDLINGFQIRYVQSDHKNKEPHADSFVFHVTDGVNQSPTYNFVINIELTNDEAPVAVFEPLYAEYNNKTIITNETFLILDFDTKNDDLIIEVEELPKYGDLYLNDELISKGSNFSYSNILNNKLSYKFTSLLNSEDDIQFKISDGRFSTTTPYKIKLKSISKEIPIVETNNGLHGASGKLFYNHGVDEPSGVTYITYNITDVNGNVLPDQRFAITVRDDKLPPVIIHNKGLRVNQGKSVYLTRHEFDVKDDDTPSQNIQFKVLTQPKFGILENVREPDKMLESFMYDDLHNGYIRYAQNNFRNITGAKLDDDYIDFLVSDGKNEASVTLNIAIIRNDNLMPTLLSTFSTRVKELGKKLFTKTEFNIIDPDTPSSELKFIITHPPQYGVLEKIDKELEQVQKVKKLPLKNQTIPSSPVYTVAVTEFSLKDIESGLIYYNHKTPGTLLDRFGFVIFDGVNNMFLFNGMQLSTTQVFSVYIDSEVNQAPFIEKNLGIDYLYHINGIPGRMITANELSIGDKDDQSKDLIINIVRNPIHGIIEHRDRIGVPVSRFSQDEINQNKLFYVLKNQDDRITSDYFLFEFHDTAKNIVKNNRFDIKWSVLNFEVNEVTVMENEGKARVHILRTGNLKQYSMISCRTISDTAKSNRDSKNFDFVYTLINVEFNEGESYKACDIVIQKDSLIEPIESFYVTVEEPKYSVVGSLNRIKVNILDKQKVAVLELERIRFEVEESDKLISIPILRSGDLSQDVQIECYTQDETAQSNLDYIPRISNSFGYNLIKIPAGETFGFCDIELIDDNLHEFNSESFKVILTNPSNGAQIGAKNEAKVIIIGPNDVHTDHCKTVHLVVNENSDQIVIDIERKNIDLNQQFDVTCTSFSKIEEKDNLQNVKKAIENEDFVPVDEVIRFLPGEQSKKCYIKILNDNLNPIMEGLKMFNVQIKPIVKNDKSSKNLCGVVEPDVVYVTIDDTTEDSISVGFNKTNFVVQETSGNISIPIIRHGDLSQSFSLICYTRQLTAIEDKDYIGRYTLEQSRIQFEPGDRVKECTIQIINDSMYEADETFQVKLSDIRGSKDVNFDQLVTATVTILNEEDATILSLSEAAYYTEEPSSNDSLIIKPITVVRTGDLSRKSIVRISTSDGTAKAGKDYKPRTETITFEPGVSALDFDIKILYDLDEENTEYFKVYLGPQDPIAAVFGKILSSDIIIKDNNITLSYKTEENDFNEVTTKNPAKMNNIEQISSTTKQKNLYNLDQLPSSPYLMSLRDFKPDEINTFKSSQDSNQKITYVSASYPLICVHVCDKQHPDSNRFNGICNIMKNITVSYSWEVSAPNEFGKYSNYVKLSDYTIFSYVNHTTLEPFYFRAKFRVRCLTQLLRNSRNEQIISNRPLKSNSVEITSESHLIDDSNYKNKNDLKCFDNDERRVSDMNVFNVLPISQQNMLFEQSISARAEYVPHDSSTPYRDRVKIDIDVSYHDGMIPLISTVPLQNCRYALTDQQYTTSHLCSNFIDKFATSNNPIKYGFVNDNLNRNSNFTDFMSKYRDNKSLKFYSNLDLNECKWKFTAYYNVNELVDDCKAKILYESETRESGKNFITLKVPIYVSFVYANAPVGWNCAEHKTELETSLHYTLFSFDEPTNEIDVDNSLLSISVDKLLVDRNGKLIVEFTTIPLFDGHFVKSHPMLDDQMSHVIGPNNIEYELELVWTQYSDDKPEQHWRVKSTDILHDYTGNFTLELLPCISDTKKQIVTDCVPKIPIRYSLSIILEQTMRPIPVKYSLDTTFRLSAFQSELSDQEFDGYFRKDDNLYGAVSWNPKQDSTSAYKLKIEKVYLCSALDGHVPIYDPDGTFYKKGPQFGCSEPHKSLEHRFLLLNRDSLNGIKSQLPLFNGKFINENDVSSSEKSNNTILDGFTFNVKPLFFIDSNQTITKSNWYVQVFFYIGPSSTINSIKTNSILHRKRDNSNYYTNIYNLNNVYNNGTNIQKLKLTDKERPQLVNRYSISSKTGGKIELKHQSSNSSRSQRDIILKFVIPILILVLLGFLTLIAVFLIRKYKNINNLKSPPFPVNTSPSNSTNSTIVIVPTKAEYIHKEGTIQTKLLKSDPFNDDSNCTLQTVISSSTSSTNSNILTNEGSFGVINHHQVCSKNSNDANVIYSTEKLKTFFKKMYTPVPTESDDSTNFGTTRYANYASNKCGSNYLYFNYNNNDLNISSDVSKIHSSTRSLVTSNGSNQKRLSGTEV